MFLTRVAVGLQTGWHWRPLKDCARLELFYARVPMSNVLSNVAIVSHVS